MTASPRLIIALTVVGIAAIPCLGQSVQDEDVEMVVGFEKEGQTPFESALRTRMKGRSKSQADSLLAGVRSVSRVFAPGSRLRKAGGAGGQALNAYSVSVRDSAAFRQLRRRWRRQSGVRYVHPNYRFSVEPATSHRSTSPSLLQGNALADSLDHLDVIQAPEGWGRTTGDSDVTIGVVDTGFFLNHPDLKGQFWMNEEEDVNNNGRFDAADLNGVDDDGNGFVDDVIGYDFVDRSSPVRKGEYETRDPDPSADPLGPGSGHGTAVAGVATASPADPSEGAVGVAPGARLVALRAFGGDGFGQSDDIAAAIAYGATMGIDVLNLSFGRNRSVPIIRDAIEYANEQGVVVIASAGNELTDEPHYPSDYPSVLSVAWLAEDGEGLPDFNRSQYGIGVDIGAPGSDVYSTNYPSDAVDGQNSLSRNELYSTNTGSSFSAPQVAGAAALLRSADSSLSPASIRSILTATATDLVDENWDHTTGAGLLNVSRSLSRAYPARTHIDSPAHDQGFSDQDVVTVVGSAVDPSFEQYSVYYAEGTQNFDERTDPWNEISAPSSVQVLRDTLGRWSISSLEEGGYTLRLVTTLRDGRTVEDRRRVIIDRTPPEMTVEFLGSGRVQGENGVIGDIATDDLTRLTTSVRLSSRGDTVQSERVTRRHGVAWPDERGTGGLADVEIVATNASGLTSKVDSSVQIPEDRENTALFRREETQIPRGHHLRRAPDFDADGLLEIVVNRSTSGGLTDSLRSFEWAGSGFVPADSFRGRYIPRDVGDTDSNGKEELLLQIRSGTLVLEQRTNSSFPDSIVFADTTGPNTSLQAVLKGAAFTDVDSDGMGEISGTSSGKVEIVERTGSGFDQIARLPNPTSSAGRDSVLGNTIDTPVLRSGDFDDDGERDLLAGDRDGDILVYESAGSNDMELAWTFETDRVDGGNRFAVGNFSPGAGEEFATTTTYYPGSLEDGEVEPPISYYSVWESQGDDQYGRVYRLPVAGTYLSRGAMTSADFDDDGLDEIAIAHAPSLIVVDRSSAGEWRVLYESTGDTPLQSRSLLAADFDGDGTPAVIAESVSSSLVRYDVNDASLAVSPPRWTHAVPAGPTKASLEWRAPGADSVVVYAGSPGGQLDRLAATTDSTYHASSSETQQFALRAWEGGMQSPLSSQRTVRPHAAASLTSTTYPSPTTVRLRFTEPLDRGLQPRQFRLVGPKVSPDRLVQTNAGYATVLHFPDSLSGFSGRLEWRGVTDEDGLNVADTATKLTFPSPAPRTLFVEKTEILDQHRVRLEFSEPLDPDLATDTDRYEVNPRGQVATVEVEGEPPSVVTVSVAGIVIGANGQESSLKVREMRSDRGHRLSREGSTVRLTKPADDLSNVYVYPNPYRGRSHDGSVTIAGLPQTATVRIFSPGGRLVRVLNVENNRDGGAQWNLVDRRGERVPSGVYLFRVTAPDSSPVLEKAAVIR